MDNENNVVNELSNKELDFILKNIENYKTIVNSNNENYYSDDSLLIYLSEIGKEPLLTDDEEQIFTKAVKFPDKYRLISVKHIKKIPKYNLDKSLLFNSLKKCPFYDKIISDLLGIYSIISNQSDIDEMDLIKYQKISKKLNRPLDDKELKENFNIDAIDNIIDEYEILYDVKMFIAFKYAYYRIFASNLRLVVSIAKKYRNGSIDFVELINEGNIGLFKAIDRYDPSLGYKFSTYATWWIEQSISRSFIKYQSQISLPNHFYMELRRFIKSVDALEKEEKRKLTDEEISQKLNIPIEKIHEYNMHILPKLSLNSTIGKEDETPLIDIIVQDNGIEETVFTDILKKDIEEIFKYLTEREQKVIKMRFGIGEFDNYQMTLAEIASALSVSVERARQIELTALKKIRALYSRDKKLKSLQYYLK